MTNEEVERFRKEYDSLKNIKKHLLELQLKIEEYENNPIVMEYLSLKQQLEANKYYFYLKPGYMNMSEEQILSCAIKNTKINKSNNIYVYISSYIGEHQLNKVNREDELPLADIPVPYYNKNANYRKYRNIELSPSDDNYEVNVPISKCEEFERNNIVLRSYAKPGPNYYNEIKTMYLSTIYTDGETKALEKVKSKRIYKENCESK